MTGQDGVKRLHLASIDEESGSMAFIGRAGINGLVKVFLLDKLDSGSWRRVNYGIRGMGASRRSKKGRRGGGRGGVW
jgi:hypothetical protein